MLTCNVIKIILFEGSCNTDRKAFWEYEYNMDGMFLINILNNVL